jgi:carbon-monoxide dehydrogenase medium subunit
MPIAGGQSLVPLMHLRMATCHQLIDLGHIGDLRTCHESPTHVVIGAGVTHAMIEDGKVPDPSWGLMRKAARHIAYRAVRCHGTIGGSVAMADPAADWPCILLALNATVLIAAKAGERRLSMDAFLKGTYETALERGEIIKAFETPKLASTARTATSKVNRKTGAFADAICAVVMNGASSRICVAALGTRAQILTSASQALGSHAAMPDLNRAIASDIAALLPKADAYLQHLHTTNTCKAVAEVLHS